MKATLAHRTAASFLFIAMFAGCTSRTSDNAPHLPLPATSHASPATVSSSAESDAEDVPTPIPDSTDGIWKAIDQHRAKLKAIIGKGALGDIHHEAYAIRDLVAALPLHASGMSADARAGLRQSVGFVATLAERLDASGDANDKAGSQDSYDKLVAVLDGIARTK